MRDLITYDGLTIMDRDAARRWAYLASPGTTEDWLRKAFDRMRKDMAAIEWVQGQAGRIHRRVRPLSQRRIAAAHGISRGALCRAIRRLRNDPNYRS